ncbi:unnamed protein product [Discosporangium mesarthrocarpum]
MFVLTTIRDTVKVPPVDFDKKQVPMLTQQIEAKFSNKVIMNVGMCICLYDYESIGDPYIYPSDGSAHYKVQFRLLVFRPFVGEILGGKVVSCTREGIRVSLDFFSDVTVPKNLLQSPSFFTQGEWIWSYTDPDAAEEEGMNGGDEEEEPATFTIANHDLVRFRVRTLNFTTVTSTEKGYQATIMSQGRDQGVGAGDRGSEAPRMRERGRSFDLSHEEEHPSAMSIVASMNEEGLGLASWWE